MLAYLRAAPLALGTAHDFFTISVDNSVHKLMAPALTALGTRKTPGMPLY